MTREEYVAKRKELHQNGVVNFKSCRTMTISGYNWTYKTTGSDVVSIITTSFPYRNGEMKDIKLYNEEMNRY